MTVHIFIRESAVSAAAVGAAFTERIGLLPPANRCRESSSDLVSPATQYFSRKEERHILSWFVSFRVRGIITAQKLELATSGTIDWIAVLLYTLKI